MKTTFGMHGPRRLAREDTRAITCGAVRSRMWVLALVIVMVATLACASLASPYDDWSTWEDPAAGFALLLPPTHDVGNSGRIWYVHGYLDGEPLVPDMSIEFRPGASLDAALAELADDVLVEWVRLGTDTPARRITAQHDGIDGPYVSSWYLVPSPGGVFELRGWENLFWELFHHVAVTFTDVDR